MDRQGEDTDTPQGPLALRREMAAGLSLVALGTLALWAGSDLPFMSQGSVGSGLLPRLLGLLIVGLGVAQVLVALRNPGPSMGHWAIRQMVPVVVGIVLFAITIRGFEIGPLHIPPLGLAVASPLAIIASGLAAQDARPLELGIFAVVLTGFCIGLFRYALGLSIPVAPWLLGV